MFGRQLLQQKNLRPGQGRPEEAFARELSERVLGNRGLRNRYLEQTDAGRGIVNVTGPVTSLEQASILHSGRLLLDRDRGQADGDSSFKSGEIHNVSL
jgi:conjugal transfer mating pair stabilization protein TraG